MTTVGDAGGGRFSYYFCCRMSPRRTRATSLVPDRSPRSDQRHPPIRAKVAAALGVAVWTIGSTAVTADSTNGLVTATTQAVRIGNQTQTKPTPIPPTGTLLGGLFGLDVAGQASLPRRLLAAAVLGVATTC
jgi:hypothetical protein